MTGAILGIALNTFLPDGLGFYESILGWGVGLLLLLPCYFLRVMGAGDVKLVAMVGAFVGLANIMIVLLYIMVAGGVLALVVALLRGKLPKLIDNLAVIFLSALTFNRSGTMKEKISVLDVGSTSIEKLPYGVAIACGTMTFLILSYL